MITRQTIVYPLFKRGATYTNPDGSSWDPLEPGDKGYDNQFIDCFVSDGIALGRYPNNLALWFVGNVSGGQLYRGGGGCDWYRAKSEFAQQTGEHVPDTWQELARMT